MIEKNKSKYTDREEVSVGIGPHRSLLPEKYLQIFLTKTLSIHNKTNTNCEEKFNNILINCNSLY